LLVFDACRGIGRYRSREHGAHVVLHRSGIGVAMLFGESQGTIDDYPEGFRDIGDHAGNRGRWL
jgi:hypothetical protein